MSTVVAKIRKSCTIVYRVFVYSRRPSFVTCGIFSLIHGIILYSGTLIVACGRENVWACGVVVQNVHTSVVRNGGLDDSSLQFSVCSGHRQLGCCACVCIGVVKPLRFPSCSGACGTKRGPAFFPESFQWATMGIVKLPW